MAGRPTKLTAEVRRVILQAMRMQLFAEQAAALAGIDPATLDTWLHKGRNGGASLYVQFAREFELARVSGERTLVGLIMKGAQAGKTDDAKWILERRAPKRWGLQVRVTIEQEQAAFLERLRERLSPEAYAAVIRAAVDEPGEAAGIGSGETR
jgi:hypothetical protein